MATCDQNLTDKAVVLLSGGMDSATLLAYVKASLAVPEIHALSFLYGQKHSRELEMARWQANSAGVTAHEEIDIGAFGAVLAGGSALITGGADIPDLARIPESDRRQPSTYVPNRNMVFLSLAAAYAEGKGMADVFYGAQAQDEYGYWDCTNEFVDRMNHVFALNRKIPVKIRAPFVGKSKAEVLKIGLELGVDYDHTWSCYRGEEEPCGSCPSCVERTRAFQAQEEV